MKVGIVGAGEISEFHVSFTKENRAADIVAICDLNRAKAEKIAQRFGIPSVHNDLSSMLAKSSPDVVHILTPPRSHTSLAIDAMNAGCHVLAEKPMALTFADAKEMVNLSRSKKVRLCVCHMYLFDPMVIRLRELVSSGHMGEVIYVETYWFTDISSSYSGAYAFRGNNTGWAYGLPGSVFANFLDHPVYLQKEFLKEITSVSVSTKKFGNNPFVPYDEIRINLEGPNSYGSIISSLNIKPRLNLLRIYGTRMIATADLSNMTFTTQPTKNLPHLISKAYINLNQSFELASDTIKTPYKILSGKIKTRQGLRTFIRNFYESLLLDIKPPVSPEEGLENVKILSQIWRKAEANIKAQKSAIIYAVERKADRLNGEPDRARSQTHTNQSKSERILVTGATGFLGSHLVDKLLEKKFQVRVLARKIERGLTENPKLDIVYGDIRDIDSLRKSIQGIDVVYHLAGRVTNRGRWEDFRETTIDATRNLLDLSREVGVSKFVYVSSVVVYGFKRINGRNVIRENDAYASDLGRYYYYAKSKIQADKLVLDYFMKYGLPTTVIRPGIIYGPRGKNIFNNKKFVIGQAEKILPYTYVENVVDAIILAGAKEEALGQAYNIVDDGKLTQKQFLEKIAKISNSKKRSVFVPMPITYSAAVFFEHLAARKRSNTSPPISMYTVDTVRRNLIYDTTKAKSELGWNPKVPLEEGLKRTFRLSS
ncbi:MAG: NAD-dependent epimerase/dehydratase family protein [Candidatus Hodarchaeota archaeon]